jgi:hypothetical protein
VAKHSDERDLRRTTATGMADIGIQPHIIEAMTGPDPETAKS